MARAPLLVRLADATSRCVPAALLPLAMALPLSSLLAAETRQDPAPGTYQTEGGWGRLQITARQPVGLRFDLRAEGPNGHSCRLAGEILAGVSSLTPDGATEVCRVSFHPEGNRIDVSTNGAASCREYCGVRASFEGRYLRRASACGDASRKQARREFRKLYDAGKHAAAAARLQPVLDQCATSLPWHEAGWIRNDLALARYKAGDAEGCLRALEPLLRDAARTEAELREALPPSDATRALAIARATRTNHGLCSAKAEN
jgi:hypothetical protein